VDSERELRSEFRRALDVVLPPAPRLEDTVIEAFHKHWQTRAEHQDVTTTPCKRLGLPRPATQLAAGLLTLLVAFAAAGVLLAIHNSLLRNAPAKQHASTSAWTPPPQGFTTTCYWGSPKCPLFISADKGWMAQNAAGAYNAAGSAFGPFALYQTLDGGRRWTQRLTWSCPAPSQILFSGDGKEGLVVAFSAPQGIVANRCPGAIFHTTDGGAHWQQVSIGAVPQKVNTDIWGRSDIFFLNTREGWASYGETVPSGAVLQNLIHTTDSGAHWTLLSRVNWQAQFGADWAGQLVFRDASTGFLLPPPAHNSQTQAAPPFFFITQDGGAHWQMLHLTAPPGSQLHASNALFVPYMASEVTVLEVAEEQPAGEPRDYIFGATGNADNWSFSIELPDSLRGMEIHFIDMRHWIGRLSDGGLVRTDDGGKHWSRINSTFPPQTVSVGIEPFRFVDPFHGWTLVCPYGEAIGSDPLASISCLSTTSDGGVHWTRLALPPSK
jgi:photosystem II stability/assembly factor-like uncharacterized protein